MAPARNPSYHDYLQLDRILGAQLPPTFESDSNDDTRELIHHEELLFIVMHQTIEIWFKLLLADLAAARDLLRGAHMATPNVPEGDIPSVAGYLRRSAKILEHLTAQFGIIETMEPQQFLAFRDHLIPSSGFQSWQFRELEILAGLPDDDRINFEGKPYFSAFAEDRLGPVQKRLAEPNLRTTVLEWLARTPVDQAYPNFADVYLERYDQYIDEQIGHQKLNENLSAEQFAGVSEKLNSSKAVAKKFFTGNSELQNKAHVAYIFISTYRHEPLLRWPYDLLKSVLEFEEHFRLFRFRHARMVERMIGLRVGSGGSSGVGYLDATANKYRIFGELLLATSYLIEENRIPEIPHPDCLRFRFDDDAKK